MSHVHNELLRHKKQDPKINLWSKTHLVFDILAKDKANPSYSLNTPLTQALNHLTVLTLKLHAPLLLGSLRYYAVPRSVATAA